MNLEQRPLPVINPLNRFQLLLDTYNITESAKILDRKHPDQLQTYQMVQKLKLPGNAQYFQQQKIDKCKLPVPPIDVKQAWSNNQLDRFTDRFLITVNDFDDNDQFYVQNQITMQLNDDIQLSKPQKQLNIKQNQLTKLKQSKLLKQSTQQQFNQSANQSIFKSFNQASQINGQSFVQQQPLDEEEVQQSTLMTNFQNQNVLNQNSQQSPNNINNISVVPANNDMLKNNQIQQNNILLNSSNIDEFIVPNKDQSGLTIPKKSDISQSLQQLPTYPRQSKLIRQHSEVQQSGAKPEAQTKFKSLFAASKQNSQIESQSQFDNDISFNRDDYQIFDDDLIKNQQQFLQNGRK